MGTVSDPIERYLDQLLIELRGRATDVRRILAETEEHLSDAVAEAVAEGLTISQAEDRAIARFGSPRLVARRFGPATGPVLPELARAIVLLAAVGLIAIGASGALSMGLRAAFGSSFVAGDPIGVTYTPARCADFRRFHPEAGSCTAAANAHHADEVETYRAATGVLGLMVLAGWAVRRRRRPRNDAVGVLPDAFSATVGTTVFGVAGGLLVVQGLAMLREGGDRGPGQWLSGGGVALTVAAYYGWTLLQSLRVRATIVR